MEFILLIIFPQMILAYSEYHTRGNVASMKSQSLLIHMLQGAATAVLRFSLQSHHMSSDFD